MKSFKQFIKEEFSDAEIESKALALFGLKQNDLGTFYYGNRCSTKAKVKFYKWSPNDRITVGLKFSNKFMSSLTVSCDVDKEITKVLSKPFVSLSQTDFEFGAEKDDFPNVVSNFIAGGKFFNELCDLISVNYNKPVNEIKKIIDDYSKKLNKSTFKIEFTKDGTWFDLTLYVLPKNKQKEKWIPYFFVMYRTDKNGNIIGTVQERCIASQIGDDGVESMNKIFNNFVSDLKSAVDAIKKMN